MQQANNRLSSMFRRSCTYASLYLGACLGVQGAGILVSTSGNTRLGVNDYGNLIYGQIGLEYSSGGQTYESLDQHAHWEGWGIAFNKGAQTLAGFVCGTELLPGPTYTNHVYAPGATLQLAFAEYGQRVLSQVKIIDDLQVTHEFFPHGSVQDLFEVTVTVKNISSKKLEDIVYRRLTDFDVDPTPLDETIEFRHPMSGTPPSDVAVSLYGQNYPNPLVAALPATWNTMHGVWPYDPQDPGRSDKFATFDIDLGDLWPGEVRRFSMFYGAFGTGQVSTMDTTLAGVYVSAYARAASTLNMSGPFFVVGYRPGTFSSASLDLDAGSYHALLLDSNGVVKAAGYNGNGQIGLGSGYGDALHFATVPIPSGNQVVQIATGPNHSFAIRNNGSVLTWGRNYYGQLGIGTTTDQFVPIAISSSHLQNVVSIAGAEASSVAVTDQGNVYTWGANTWYGLGNGSATSSTNTTPVQLQNISDIRKVAAGGYHVLALHENGTVYSWGTGGSGVLGHGNTQAKSIPTLIADSDVYDIVDIACGRFSSMALRADGQLIVWGHNQYQQLGITSATYYEPNPTPMSLGGIARIEPGLHHALAITSSGVYTWGRNNFGQLGTGTSPSPHTITPQLVNVPGWVTIGTSGGNFSHVINVDGDGYSWGLNGYGCLGIGYPSGIYITPQQVP